METNEIAILGGLQPLTCGLEVSCSIQFYLCFTLCYALLLVIGHSCVTYGGKSGYIQKTKQ